MKSATSWVMNFAEYLQSRWTMRSISGSNRRMGFMILGIQKGGTSWLAGTLSELPELQLSFPKETKFFNALWNPRYERLSDEQLRALYFRRYWPKAFEGQIQFEASPGYLASSSAARRVARYFPNVKCVVLLRNPASRAFSNYNMWVRNRGLQASFRDLYAPLLAEAAAQARLHRDELDFYHAVSQTREQHLISHGLYYFHFRIWFAVLPREQFFIMTTKQLRDRAVWEKLLAFLDLDRDLIGHVSLQREVKHRHEGAPLAARDADELQAFFEPYNAKLFQLLGVPGLDW